MKERLHVAGLPGALRLDATMPRIGRAGAARPITASAGDLIISDAKQQRDDTQALVRR
jgi:hypothetical protein